MEVLHQGLPMNNKSEVLLSWWQVFCGACWEILKMVMVWIATEEDERGKKKRKQQYASEQQAY